MDRDPRELGDTWPRHQRHTYRAPAAGSQQFVERLWAAEWDYPEPYRQKIVPLPNVHLTVRSGAEPEIHGVASRHGLTELAGRGSVVGVQFRVGVARTILGRPVRTLTDRVVPAGALPAFAGRAGPRADLDALEAWLVESLPAAGPDPAGREAGALVELIAADPAIARVEALAAVSGHGVRRLQRMFAEHVGIGPKWVIRRFRLQEVTARMAAGGRVDWAGLAAELGYADQPHLVRDFTGIFGEPPTRYQQRYPTAASG